MKIQPPISVKSLFKTNSGELIRVNWGTSALAIVARMGAKTDSKTMLVFLNPVDGGSNVPSFLNPQVDKTVVSYGSDFEINISQEKEFIDPDNSKFFKSPGTLHVSKSGQILLAARSAMRTEYMGDLFFDLRNGEFVDANHLDLGASFAKWSLKLPAHKDGLGPEMNLFSFELPKR